MEDLSSPSPTPSPSHPHPPSSLSPQAISFISQSSGASWVAADFSPSGLSTLRSDNSEVGAAAWQLVKKSCSVTYHDDVVGGVTCQWVTPVAPLRGDEVLLFLFGGAFVVGSPEDDLSMTARIATCMGRRVCVPRYRLAPEHPYPAAYNDVCSVYHALSTIYNKVGIIGESAGGNLALGLVLSLYSSHSSAVQLPFAVALLSPWLDLTHSGDSHLILRNLDPTLSVPHFLKPASLLYANQLPVSSPQISPLFAEIKINFPPTIISTATRDLLLSDCTRLAKKLRAKGCMVDLRIEEGLWHVYEWYPECPEAVESLREISRFLESFCNSRKQESSAQREHSNE